MGTVTRLILGTSKGKRPAPVALAFGFKEVVTPERTIEVTGEKVYSVWIKTGNYDGHVRGGIRYSWKLIKGGLDLKTAEELFRRRTGGA